MTREGGSGTGGGCNAGAVLSAGAVWLVELWLFEATAGSDSAGVGVGRV